jgi:hypothetical protein
MGMSFLRINRAMPAQNHELSVSGTYRICNCGQARGKSIGLVVLIGSNGGIFNESDRVVPAPTVVGSIDSRHPP